MKIVSTLGSWAVTMAADFADSRVRGTIFCELCSGRRTGYVSQRTDEGGDRAHDSDLEWAHDLPDRPDGEICIVEHGETTFFVDDLRILLTRGSRWLRTSASRSALDASRQKT